MKRAKSELCIIFAYVKSLISPRISKKSFHEKYSPYATLNASTRLLEDAFQKEISTGPYLYCNRGIFVELTKDCNGFELYEKRIRDPKVTYAMALMGEHSLLVFSRGASTLDHATCTKPSLGTYTSFEDIQFDERGIGELPPDPYPVGWGEMEWAVYDLRKNPRIPYLKVAPELEVSWDTV